MTDVPVRPPREEAVVLALPARLVIAAASLVQPFFARAATSYLIAPASDAPFEFARIAWRLASDAPQFGCAQVHPLAQVGVALVQEGWWILGPSRGAERRSAQPLLPRTLLPPNP